MAEAEAVVAAAGKNQRRFSIATYLLKVYNTFTLEVELLLAQEVLFNKV